MKIGIDASRAFLKNRTGIEEYSYQVIKHFTNTLREEQVVLYLRKGQEIDFALPAIWKSKIIKWPRFWTQIGLSLEMLMHPIQALFVPAHTVPIIHPKNTTVVVHGLEYEFCPEAYSFLEKIYMRWTIKKSCKWARKIISVSENTKKDLVRLYKVPAEKISVIYEGYEENFKLQMSNSKQITNDQILKTPCYSGFDPESRNTQSENHILKRVQDDKYFLFVGRIEQRKNIGNVVKAFEIFKEKSKTGHKLVLAGRLGYGYEDIKSKISNSKYKEDIIELGFVSEQDKWELLKKADVFVFTTLYEGFGIPILEAQSMGCPVIASNNSSIPEVTDESALLVDPTNFEQIADKLHDLIHNSNLRNDIIQKGFENVKRFSWEKCAREIAGKINGD